MNNCYPFVNTPLPYGYDALEPYIDRKTMELHHDRHLQTYIDNLNASLENESRLQCMTLHELLSCRFNAPENVRIAVCRNAGGVFNHRFYFDSMSPDGGKLGDGCLKDEITRVFGGEDLFKEKFKSAALSVFGSGYAWLVKCENGIKITTTANQDTPLCLGQRPLMCIDVWEHAYYLKHYNKRGDYIDDWFNVVDYNKAEKRYEQ